MGLAGIIDTLLTDPELSGLDVEQLPEATIVAAEPLYPFLAATLTRHTGRPVLAVTATGREADDLAAAAGSILGADRVASYPAWETLPHERLSPRADTVGRRLAVLHRLRHPGENPLAVVAAPIRAVLQPQIANLGDLTPLEVHTGDTVELDDLVARLVNLAYTRVDLVEKRGEFAVRGGILDVFSPTESHPIRIEFWGDEVEEIRYFRVSDQRSLEISEAGIVAPPCRELLLTDEVRARARALIADHPELLDVLDPISEGIAVEGMEALAPVLVDQLRPFHDDLPADALTVVVDPERVKARAVDLVRTSNEFLQASWMSAGDGGKAPIDLGAAAYRTLDEIHDHVRSRSMPWWEAGPFGGDGSDGATIRLSARSGPEFGGDRERAMQEIAEACRTKAVVAVTRGAGLAERIGHLAQEAGIDTAVVADLPDAPPVHQLTVTTGMIGHGFVDDAARLVVLSETDLTGNRSPLAAAERRLPSRRRNQVDPLALTAGDYVVHDQHGVGRFVEMVQRTVAGATREYLVIEYAPAKRGQPGDRLFVPTDQLEQLTKYSGGESPTLNRLGGSDWAKTKSRAKKAVKEIAAELIRLYSARMATKGYAFGPDTPWQRELEDAFDYVETPDQLEAIEEVKRDMEQPVPMDRLICGDVGYGKTEIAVRAAFKAIADGKQVAVLVPTTLLAQQHFETFSDRYGAFPVTVKALSRFQSDAEQAAVVAGLADGSIDLVVGTHRILSSTVRFKDLGLVIVDEEQRFGVEHKEHLKRLRTNVDVLSMSATPIPRTLEMAVTGIREMSTILTPPEERHPVLTYVGPYDSGQITAAIHRELMRDGQIFYVHNRVESIQKAAKGLAALVPEARIGVAHGQMNETALEQVMDAFWRKDIDILMSTTIVENGLDVANANTLIVERADLLGLSQLHQLRGRVGRARERAYAYFLYPPEKPLTETAHDRLVTIAQNSELGAGMAVAMKDLEIRGAGNLLGGEQSGHIAAVGFDLYVRLVGEAVAEFKGGVDTTPNEVKIELPVEAHLPAEYVNGERLRLEAYRKIAMADSDDKLADIRSELTDRYGTPPKPVENLFAVAAFRNRARAAGLTEVTFTSSPRGQQIRFAPVELAESKRLRLARLYPGAIIKAATGQIFVPAPRTAAVGGQPVTDIALLDWCAGVLAAFTSEIGDTGSSGGKAGAARGAP